MKKEIWLGDEKGAVKIIDEELKMWNNSKEMPKVNGCCLKVFDWAFKEYLRDAKKELPVILKPHFEKLEKAAFEAGKAKKDEEVKKLQRYIQSKKNYYKTSLKNLYEKNIKRKKQERLHHEFFELLKKEVGEAKYYRLLKKAEKLLETK